MSKKNISVIISDVDDILIDFSESHASATEKALKSIASLKNIDKKDLERLLLRNSKWKGYNKNIAEIISDPIDEVKPDDFKQENEYAKVLQDWRKDLSHAKVIEGVIITARKIKASGSLFILYSDYPESLLLLRLQNVGFPVELVDGVYAKPNQRKTETPSPAIKIKGVVSEFKEKLELNGSKLMAIDFENSKEDVKFILKDIGCAKANFDKALLVADANKFDFAPIKELGVNTAGVNEAKDTKKAPEISLTKGFVDINNHFVFNEFKRSEINLARVMQGIKQR
ncbi:MAG: hypothetical protein BWY78_00550 [Alphaproteobacteria bacterium ADurb.Bin438]|nr:MAG: hypothetical protein BWY78_00550 [Alphaproteobacteria bacterium ADurb.Bin438]